MTATKQAKQAARRLKRPRLTEQFLKKFARDWRRLPLSALAAKHGSSHSGVTYWAERCLRLGLITLEQRYSHPKALPRKPRAFYDLFARRWVTHTVPALARMYGLHRTSVYHYANQCVQRGLLTREQYKRHPLGGRAVQPARQATRPAIGAVVPRICEHCEQRNPRKGRRLCDSCYKLGAARQVLVRTPDVLTDTGLRIDDERNELVYPDGRRVRPVPAGEVSPLTHFFGPTDEQGLLTVYRYAPAQRTG